MENPNEFSELSLVEKTDSESRDFEAMLKLASRPEEFLQLGNLQRLAFFLESHPKLGEGQCQELKDALLGHQNFSEQVSGLDLNNIEEARKCIRSIGRLLRSPLEIDWMLGAKAGYGILKPLIEEAFNTNDFSKLAVIGQQWMKAEKRVAGVIQEEGFVNIFGNALAQYIRGKAPQEILDIFSNKAFTDLMIADDPVHGMFIGFTKDNARRDLERAEKEKVENGLAA